MGQAAAIANIVFICIALVLYIASFATPWYVIEVEMLDKIEFKWGNAQYNEFMGGSKATYSYDALKTTFNTTGIFLGVSLAAAFINLITLISHLANKHNTRKSLINSSRSMSWIGLIFAIICIAYFPGSFTSHIQEEPFFCPNGSATGYYCTSFSGRGDTFGTSGFDRYGGGPGYYLVIPIIVFQVLVVGFSFALKPHSVHHKDVAQTIVHPAATPQVPVVTTGTVYIQSPPVAYGYGQPPAGVVQQQQPVYYAQPPYMVQQYPQQQPPPPPYMTQPQPYMPQPPNQYTHAPPPVANTDSITIDSSYDPNAVNLTKQV